MILYNGCICLVLRLPEFISQVFSQLFIFWPVRIETDIWLRFQIPFPRLLQMLYFSCQSLKNLSDGLYTLSFILPFILYCAFNSVFREALNKRIFRC